ncbi:adenylate/guanylate cyclase domain-containing response regulator [Gracilimonas amylolytica]|uniref:adenylate/guanylate cyclase domain-containing response regulator n=1 Tax=Gracilimonas amylolytica TaxID=1749045 RepID=UPI000CD933F7|nr:adenylate/guanylate cyclase domain-containing protein [Gracilimonas amylolytica]
MLETKPRILVVDDHPALVTLTRHKLIQKGYEVLTAQNGEDALELARTEYPDLILSDVEMPVMDGFELCERIKKDSRLNKIPLILVTSMVTTEYIMRGIEAGADNYLTKPYDDDTLYTKIKELLQNPPPPVSEVSTVEVNIEGKTYNILADYSHLVNLLISTYKNTLAQNNQLSEMQSGLNAANKELEITKQEHEELIHNIFPEKIAENLLAYGTVTPERYEDSTIMFTDFVGFTKVVPDLSAEQLIESLSFYFDKFDDFTAQHNMIKIKTIGDSYMAAGGLPDRNSTHPVDAVLTALKIVDFVRDFSKKSLSETPYLPIRIGVHTGKAVVGVIGKKRFAYDMWGETVNLAARLEQHSDENQINISETTYQRVKDFFECEPRGDIETKYMGKVPMYFVKRIKPDYSEDDEGMFPNRLFVREYNSISRQHQL